MHRRESSIEIPRPALENLRPDDQGTMGIQSLCSPDGLCRRRDYVVDYPHDEALARSFRQPESAGGFERAFAVLTYKP